MNNNGRTVEFYKIDDYHTMVTEIRPVKCSFVSRKSQAVKTTKWMELLHWQELEKMIKDILLEYKEKEYIHYGANRVTHNDYRDKVGENIKLGYVYQPYDSCGCHFLTPRQDISDSDSDCENGENKCLKNKGGRHKKVTLCDDSLVISVCPIIKSQKDSKLKLHEMHNSPQRLNIKLKKALNLLDNPQEYMSSVSEYFTSQDSKSVNGKKRLLSYKRRDNKRRNHEIILKSSDPYLDNKGLVKGEQKSVFDTDCSCSLSIGSGIETNSMDNVVDDPYKGCSIKQKGAGHLGNKKIKVEKLTLNVDNDSLPMVNTARHLRRKQRVSYEECDIQVPVEYYDSSSLEDEKVTDHCTSKKLKVECDVKSSVESNSNKHVKTNHEKNTLKKIRNKDNFELSFTKDLSLSNSKKSCFRIPKSKIKKLSIPGSINGEKENDYLFESSSDCEFPDLELTQVADSNATVVNQSMLNSSIDCSDAKEMKRSQLLSIFGISSPSQIAKDDDYLFASSPPENKFEGFKLNSDCKSDGRQTMVKCKNNNVPIMINCNLRKNEQLQSTTNSSSYESRERKRVGKSSSRSLVKDYTYLKDREADYPQRSSSKELNKSPSLSLCDTLKTDRIGVRLHAKNKLLFKMKEKPIGQTLLISKRSYKKKNGLLEQSQFISMDKQKRSNSERKLKVSKIVECEDRCKSIQPVGSLPKDFVSEVSSKSKVIVNKSDLENTKFFKKDKLYQTINDFEDFKDHDSKQMQLRGTSEKSKMRKPSDKQMLDGEGYAKSKKKLSTAKNSDDSSTILKNLNSKRVELVKVATTPVVKTKCRPSIDLFEDSGESYGSSAKEYSNAITQSLDKASKFGMQTRCRTLTVESRLSENSQLSNNLGTLESSDDSDAEMSFVKKISNINKRSHRKTKIPHSPTTVSAEVSCSWEDDSFNLPNLELTQSICAAESPTGNLKENSLCHLKEPEKVRNEGTNHLNPALTDEEFFTTVSDYFTKMSLEDLLNRFHDNLEYLWSITRQEIVTTRNKKFQSGPNVRNEDPSCFLCLYDTQVYSKLGDAIIKEFGSYIFKKGHSDGSSYAYFVIIPELFKKLLFDWSLQHFKGKYLSDDECENIFFQIAMNAPDPPEEYNFKF